MNHVQRPPAKTKRRLVATLAAAVVALSALVAPTAAAASPAVPLAVPGGPATVATSVDFVSGLDLTTPITELKANEVAPVNERRYALQIVYSCGSASPCSDVTIKIDPQPLDPVYGTQRFATYDSSTLPAGATISGTPDAGYTVSLGNLGAGASGAFTVLYSWQTRLMNTPAAQSFFLDGTTITNTVTIDASNAAAAASASDSVTWRIDTKAPLVAFVAPKLARANTDYTYVVRMATDCMWYYSSANYGEPAKLCAEEYSNTLTLPAGVTFVSSSPDGTYDSATNTVSWSKSGYGAAAGWGSVNGRGQDRTVTVQFPDSMFTNACTMDVTATLATDVTYLDGQKKSASTSTTHAATNCTPFASATKVSKTASRSAAPNIVWDSGTENTFSIRVGNKANVPGVAVITDNNLNIPNLRVYRVSATGGTIDYVLDDGTAGTATSTYQAPSGRRLASIVVTSPELIGPNEVESSQPNTTFYDVTIRYAAEGDAPPEGWTRSNTATAKMTYPNSALADVDEGTSTATVVVAPRPATFSAGINRAVPGGGNPTAGQPVDFTVTARAMDIKAGATIEPQYVFVAPPKWSIVQGSWNLAAGAPAGAIFEKKTVTIAGEAREAVYVHWPAGTTWGMNEVWPNLNVQATPSALAAAGSSGVASAFTGDASHSFPGLAATWNSSRFTDAPDLDGDGDTSEYFATSNAQGVTVGAASGLGTMKEICRANPDTPGGCDWIADSAQTVLVSPVATDIKYRITLRNNGNTALANVVAYDVLPHPGDTGVSGGSASTPRGSTFAESISTVSGASANLALTYSGSTNPCRPEVYPGGPSGCANDWAAGPTDKVAIRAAVTGTLAPGATASFVYTANVLGDPGAGAKACNSIAGAATGVPISEPSPVCAQIEAADLKVTAGTVTDPQVGRPAVLPFDVSNAAGTTTQPTVAVDVPAGVRVTALAFGDWTCTSSAGDAPVDGPVTLTCSLPEPLDEGEVAALPLPVVLLADGVTVKATVDGPLYDPVPGNNSDTITLDAAPAAAAGLNVAKDDTLAALVPGQETSYTISVANQLVGEVVNDVTVTDVLPAALEFVSASDGGTYDAGSRTVTWQVPTLGAADTTDVTLTVRLAADSVANSVTNTVTADAPDPAFPGARLTGSASDADQVDRIALKKTATMRAPGNPADPQPGDVLEYTFLIQNTGGGTLTAAKLTDPKAGLSALSFPDGWPTRTGDLGAGESVKATATYRLTAEDIDAGVTSNTATVTAQSAGGQNVTASSSVDFALPAVGGIALTKTAALDVAGTAQAGDKVVFEFGIQNTGNVTLHDVAIDDAFAGMSAVTYTWPDKSALGNLESGASATASATYQLTQADIDRGTVSNTATASGLDTGNVRFDATDTAQVTIPAAPDAAFEKTGELVGDGTPRAGDEVAFEFTVDNTGNVTLTNLSIADHLDGVSVIIYGDWPTAAGTLAPGETITGTASYLLTQEDIDAGELVNTATLTGTPARGDAVERDADTTVTLPQAPDLTIVKSATLDDTNRDSAANPGEKITYTFVISNTGNVTLTGVTVDDPKVSGVPVTATLAPGQSVQVSADPYTVTYLDALAGTVANTATARGEDPTGTPVVSDPSSTKTAATLPPGGLLSGDLASTGVEIGIWVAAALLVLTGAGFLMVVAAKRRRTDRTES